jgi:hypothetical protein
MAGRKETIWQNDFSLGVIRPEAEERDDIALIEKSTLEASNTITLSTGQCESRPGTAYLNDVLGTHGFEAPFSDARIYEVVINSDGLEIFIPGEAKAIGTITGVDWANMTGGYGNPNYDDIEFWLIPDPDTSSILIGSKYFPTQQLSESSGSWSLSDFPFSTTAAGAYNLPFWRHYRDVTIQPSALTGSITITASDNIWSTDHNGVMIRYGDRQILLGSRLSETVINATVIEELPPTMDLVVADASGFQVGDAVEAEASGGQGVITEISGTTITVLVTTNFTGFATSEDLVGPNAASNMTSVTAATTKAATYLWDMQMWNPIHGYPGTSARHGGRMFLGGFPELPLAFAASASQDIYDFSTGINDGDGFAEAISADAGGEIQHIISAEDLLFFTSRGLFYQLTRDGSAVTPETIRPVRFSRIGSSKIRPVAVDDGAVFVDATGNQVHAAVLSGDVYRSWRVEAISRYAPHVIGTPVYLGATSSGHERPELLVIVTMEDGTAAVAQWDRTENIISWRPWTTEGEFKAIYQASGTLRAIVDRTINGVEYRFSERFVYGCVLDCASFAEVNEFYPSGTYGGEYLGVTTSPAFQVKGHTCQVYFEGFDVGDYVINNNGKPEDGSGDEILYPSGVDGFAQIGLHFPIMIVPWSRRSVRTQRGVREIKRLIQMFVTVHSTGVFEVNGRPYGDFFASEDLTTPPPLRSTQIKMSFLGAESYERVEITRGRPGPLMLTKLGYRVVV